jgi:hypothetical protein
MNKKSQENVKIGDSTPVKQPQIVDESEVDLLFFSNEQIVSPSNLQ